MARPDLTGLQPVYHVHLGRVLRWLFPAAFVLVVPSIVIRLADHPSAPDVLLSVAQTVGYLALCVYHLRRPDAVFVLEDGLVWQQAFRRRTAVPWPDLREVRPGNRWKGYGSAVLVDGRRFPLVAVPAPDVQRLVNALAASR